MGCTQETIIYTKTKPDTGCQEQPSEKQFYQLPLDPNSREVSIISTHPQIKVTDQSDSNKWKFALNFIPQQDLEASASITPYISDIPETNPSLIGRTIDRIDLAWTPNKEVTTQELTSDDSGITQPTLDEADRSHSYTGLSITEDTEFYLDLDDGTGLDGSTLRVTFKLLFGNYYYYGNTTDQLGNSTTGLQAILNAFTKSISTNKIKSLYPTGGENKHFLFAYPKRFGLVTEIVKGPLSGGFTRLINVSGTLKEELGDGESESEILISNGLESEAYYIYQSTFDNQEDETIPFDIS